MGRFGRSLLAWQANTAVSYLLGITAASHAPGDSGHDGTQIQEIRNSRLALGPPCGSFPHSPPPAVWPTPPEAASPPPAVAIADAAANPPESPDHRRISRIRLPSPAHAGSLLSLVPASGPPH